MNRLDLLRLLSFFSDGKMGSQVLYAYAGTPFKSLINADKRSYNMFLINHFKDAKRFLLFFLKWSQGRVSESAYSKNC